MSSALPGGDAADSAIPPRLAVQGGEPLFPDGPPAWPPSDDGVRDALEAALADGSWGRYDGRHGERLTRLLADLHGRSLAWTCSSGTVAVELALRGLAVSADDEVILAGYDFPGNFRAVEAVGATPVLVDIVPQRWCLDHRQLDAAFRPQVRAILVSHLHGGLAPIAEICEWAAPRGIAVVEDACQAPGAIVDGRPAGSWGDASVLSFGGSKLLTAGRGGAVLTDRAEVYQRLKVFCERGNNAYPLSELQAAVLIPQLSQLAERNRTRRANVQRLLEQCSHLSGLLPLAAQDAADVPSFYKLAWLYCPERCGGRSRDEFLAAVQAEGVALDAGFRGFALRSSRRCRRVGDLAASQAASQATVLLHHPILLQFPATIGRLAQAIGRVHDTFAAP